MPTLGNTYTRIEENPHPEETCPSIMNICLHVIYGFDDCNDVDKTKVLINLSNVKATAQYIVEAFKQRTKVLFSRANHNN